MDLRRHEAEAIHPLVHNIYSVQKGTSNHVFSLIYGMKRRTQNPGNTCLYTHTHTERESLIPTSFVTGSQDYWVVHKAITVQRWRWKIKLNEANWTEGNKKIWLIASSAWETKKKKKGNYKDQLANNFS